VAEGFGDLLRGFRVAASLTQEELAERCRISPATVAALEQGRRKAPRLSTVRMIADALELPAIELSALARAASTAGLAGRGPDGRAGAGDTVVGGHAPIAEAGALPVPITPLFGRATEAAAVAQVLCAERLVTLVGPGGVGKTRLALQVARDVLDKFPGGTYWVELGSVTDTDSLRDAVLRSLGASEQPGAAIGAQLLAALPRDPALLVVDNCEHVLDAAAAVIGGLLAHSPVTMLATSREPLAIPGEIRWPVRALGVPADGAGASAQSLIEVDSVALFVERATRACPHFLLGDAESGAVARICRRLDGLPLALELAAARIGGLTPAQLADELDERIPLATASARGVPSRHCTLWASIDWSYQLLSPPEQAAFRCLACFGGTFDATAFAAITAQVPGSVPPAGTGTLGQLVDKSLVAVDTQAGRYRVLDTILAFAAEQATRAGELEAIHGAHADYYSSWLLSLYATDPGDAVLDLIDADYPNVRAALTRSIEARSTRAAAIVASMGVAWHQRGRFHDAVVLGDGALAVAAGHDAPLWARAVGSIALARLLSGDIEFGATLPAAAAVAKAACDRRTEGWCHFVQGMRPSFDSVHLRAAYELGSAAGAPILASLAALNLANGGTDRFKDEWSRRAERFANELDNAPHKAFYQLARAESLAEKGRLDEAVDAAVPAAFDVRVSPTTRLLGISRTLQMALYRRDFDLAQVAAAMSDELAKVWPLGGSWQTSTWTSMGDLLRLWLALLRGEPQPVLTPDGLARAVQSALTPSVVRAVCRAAIDRGDRLEPAAIALGRVPPVTGSLMAASLAAIDAAHAVVDGDDELATRRWSAVLSVATGNEFQLLACDALEALGYLASRRGDIAAAARLLTAAGRHRTRTGYRWRFGFEQRQAEQAWAAVGCAPLRESTVALGTRSRRVKRHDPRPGSLVPRPGPQRRCTLPAGLTGPHFANAVPE
jgi:predicted ATPase/transcriptional regulator with XRE-family HTH domain